jgi:hypothetical protein
MLLVTNTNDSGPGSFRQAIIDSNASVGTLDTIAFDIPGTGVQTIAPTSALFITDPVLIDGTSQPGFAGKPLIELSGANAGSGVDGLTVSTGATINSTTIEGLDINRFSGNGIRLESEADCVIQGNFIGTNADGTAPLGNGANGILLFSDFFQNKVAQFNTIGGTTVGAANVISGNQGSGIEINGDFASQNLVEGNFIGTAADGKTAIPNAGNGVWISLEANNNTIGGTVAGAANTIAFNALSGVLVDDLAGPVGHFPFSSHNGILSNSIFGNGALGIMIQKGANDDQPFPTLISAAPANGGGTAIKGSLHQFNGSDTFRIEFFANETRDPSDFGQGQTFLGFQNVTTDASGNAQFTGVVSQSVAPGQAISATATGLGPSTGNNTSQFAKDIPPLFPKDIAGRVNETGQWWVAQSTGSNFRNQLWGSWSPAATWVDVLRGDFTGDGHDDIAGRTSAGGQWWLALSNGSGFTNQLWTTWSTAVTWVDVHVGDFNGDGKMDIAGRVLETGDWWVALSNGSTFTNQQWTRWSTAVTWKDVVIGDFDGDGRDDIAGRTAQGGEWWVGLSTGTSFTKSLWATWSTAVTWMDIRVADFNGDGKADLTGRTLEGGQWWTALSTGSTFNTSLWGTWSTGVTWVDIQVGDFNNDGFMDIIGRSKEGGQWWTGISTGSTFMSRLWATWSTAVTWVDVQVGDFNNDGLIDIAGRTKEGGEWWVGINTGSQFTTQLWTAWSTAVTWADIHAERF